MDTNAILSKLNRAAPGKILESSRFGRSETLSVWVETKVLLAVASAVRSDAELKLDWVENLSVAEIGDALVVSYFLRSTSTSTVLIIRSSIVPDSPAAVVSVPSVESLWPMVKPMENEAAELFGIRFTRENGDPTQISHDLLCGVEGYPLRKSFAFSKEDA